MLVGAVRLLVLQAAQAALAVVVLVAVFPHKMQLLEHQILAVVGEATMEFQELLRLAVLASSSFPTQAQHNYLVVALLPNQAVTSFTHSHLLAHLALCHL
jgi:hypothetical protein